MVHTPEPTNRTSPLDSVQVVPDPAVKENETVSPDDAIASGVYVEPTVGVVGTTEVKSIVCVALANVNVWLLLATAT